MGASARGFLLFSFAFSSVLSSPEIEVPSNEIETKSNLSKVELGAIAYNSTSNNVAIKGCIQEGSCTGNLKGIEKREISYSSGEEQELRRGLGGVMPMDDFWEDKRSRVGFTGMRGKKDNYESVQSDGLDGFLDLLEKRTRLGFNGMRGKRYEEKRKAMAFHGMRGKKSEDYEDESGDRMMEYVMEEIPSGEYLPEEEGWGKRTMAFHGMRGGRGSSSGEEPLLTKRMPLVMSDKSDDIKRALGFLGMRGKKTPESWSWSNYKRGVQSRFFGMKGKKAQSGFFGMRGKKNTQGFNGFQGEGLDNDINSINSVNYSVSPQGRVRRAAGWLRNSKKAKNAFFAVRGKKLSSNPNDSDFNNPISVN